MNSKNEFKKILFSTIIGTILLIFFLFFQVNTVSSVQTNSSDSMILYDGDYNLKPREKQVYNLSVDNPPLIVEINITVMENPNYSFNMVNVNLSKGFISIWGYSLPFNITKYENLTAEESSFSLLHYSIYRAQFILMNQTNYYINLRAGNIEGAEGHLIIRDITIEIMDSSGVSGNKTNGFLFLSAILILVVLKRKRV